MNGVSGKNTYLFVGGASPLVREMRVLSEKSLSFIVEDGFKKGFKSKNL